MTAMLLLSMVLLVKPTTSVQDFLSVILKSGIKNKRKKIGLSFRGRQTFIERRNRSFNGQLNTI
jgi:hypothetical protein